MNDSRYPTAAFLLEHADWLRGLVRGLIADDHDVDDIVQEAYLVALQRRTVDSGNLKAWFRGVVRKIVLQARRSDRRRAAREQAAARSDAVADSTKDVARDEELRGLIAAVLALDEPYRFAILARFYDGQSPQEIADRCGLPVETVRTRVKRGLARLRSRLDREHDGDRSAWTVPLVAITFPRETLGVETSLQLGGASTLGMPVKIGIGAGLLAAGALGVIAISQNDDAEPPAPATVEQAAQVSPAVRPIDRTEERDGVSGAVAAGDRSTPPSAAADASEHTTVGVTGIVHAADGKPLAGVAIRAFEPFRGSPRLPASRVELQAAHHTSTDERGRFALPRIPGMFVVEADHPDHARDKRVAQRTDRLEIRLAKPASFRGRLLDATTRRAVVGAKVSLLGERSQTRLLGFGANGTPYDRTVDFGYAHGVTDTDGAFTFTRIPPGDYRLSIYARSNPFVRVDRRTVRVDTHTDTVHTIVIPAGSGRALHGRVFDAQTGDAVVGASAFLRDNPMQRAVTTSDGHYSIAGLGHEATVTVIANGYSTASLAVPSASIGHIRLDVALKRPVTATGRVVAADDSPVAGAVVAPTLTGLIDPRMKPRSITDSQGRFALSDVHAGSTTRLFAAGPGFAPGFASVSFAVKHASGTTIRIARGGIIRGRLSFRNGASAGGSTLRLIETGTASGVVDAIPTATVTADGAFRFEHVPPGVYRLGCWLLGRQYLVFDRDVRVVGQETQTVSLVVRRTESVSGTVRTATGDPVRDIRVELTRSSPGRAAMVTFTDRSGRFVFFGARPETSSLAVVDRGGRRLATGAADQSDSTLTLPPSRRIDGRVVDERDQPVPSFWIRVIDADVRDVRMGRRRFFASEDGRFSLEADTDIWGQGVLPSGRLRIEAGASDDQISDVVRIDPHGSPNVRVVIRDGGSIRGLVSTSAGAPAGFARLTVESTADGSRRSFVADDRGRFTARSLRCGPHRIAAEHRDGARVVRRIDVGTSHVATVRLELPPPSRLVILVQDASGRPVVGTIVHARPHAVGHVSRHATTDHRGRASISGLSAGVYTVVTTHRGHTAQAPITLARDTTLRTTLSLR